MLQERQYVVKITALLDRSTAAAASDLVQTYDRAARSAGRRMSEEERASKRAASERERNERYVANVKERHFREEQRRQESADRKAEREAQQKTRREEAAAERTARAKERAEERAAEAKNRAEERSQRYVARIRERHFADEQRRQERDERQAERGRRDRVKQIGSDAIANAAAVGRKALGVAGEITGGFGVDFSLQRGVAKGVELEKMAVAIVNAGNRGKGSAEERDRDVQHLQESAREIGNRYAFDPTQVLGGLAKYQALTGDLDTAKAGLADLAALAKGFNVDLDKMVAAAGQVGSAIGDVGEGEAFATSAEKAAAVLDVLKSLTAQGQEGAIEIADLAVQMAKLKAAGAAFSGSTADNIKKVGALAQLSMQLGGSASATQAATSVMGFVSTLKTPARRREFAAAGVDIEDKATGMFLDPFEIIKNSLKATGGDSEKMKKLFANVVGERAVTALTNTYKKAGGGQAGLDAVDKQFKRFSGSVSDEMLKENLARAMRTQESKAQITQNQVDQRWAEVSRQVLPAFEALAPKATELVKAFGDIIVWASKSPGEAIALAIGGSIAASIAKASIGSMVGKALESAMGQKVGGAIAVGVASFTITKAVIEAFSAEVSRGETNRLQHDMLLENAKTSGRLALAGKKDATAVLAEQQAALTATEARVKGVDNLDSFGTGDILSLLGAPASILGELTGGRSYLNAINPLSDQTIAGVSEARSDAGNVDALKAEIDALKASMEGVRAQIAGGIKVSGTVSVDNMPTPSGGAAGRVGVPDQGG